MPSVCDRRNVLLSLCSNPPPGPHSPTVPYSTDTSHGNDRAVAAELIIHLETWILHFPNISFLNNLPKAISPSVSPVPQGTEDGEGSASVGDNRESTIDQDRSSHLEICR